MPGVGLLEENPGYRGRESIMKMTLSVYAVARIIKEDRHAYWSDDAALAIAQYLDRLEEETGEEYEVDVAKIRWDFAEYRDIESLVRETGRTAAEHEENGTLVAKLDNGGFVVLAD